MAGQAIRVQVMTWWAKHPGLSAGLVAQHFNDGPGSLRDMPEGKTLKAGTLRQWKARHGFPDVAGDPDAPPSPAQAESAKPAAVWVSVHSIFPWEDNPRDNDHAVEGVANSILKFGYGRTFVGWRESADRMLVVGHTARKAVLLNLERDPGAAPPEAPGADMIPIRWRDDWTEAEARGYAIADNKLGEKAGWLELELAGMLQELEADEEAGIDAELLGFDDEERIRLLQLLETETGGGGSGEDHGAVPVPDEPVSKLGEIYELGPHRLICGDCRAADVVALLMDGENISVAFTSPPYASQRKYDESSGFKPIAPDDYVEWFNAVQANVRKHLAEDGSWFVNIKEHCRDGQRNLYVKDLTIAHVRQWRWMFVDEFCWYRSGVPGKWGNRFKNSWEPVFHFTASSTIKMRHENVTHKTDQAFTYSADNPTTSTGSGFVTHASTGSSAHREGLALPGNHLDITNAKGSDHSAAFPVGLPEFFIQAFSDPDDRIFDPFLGSGTTLIAAAKHGRVCYGSEISPGYCDVIRIRWARYAEQEGIDPGPGALYVDEDAD